MSEKIYCVKCKFNGYAKFNDHSLKTLCYHLNNIQYIIGKD